jgi:Protein of unknown function DUF86
MLGAIDRIRRHVQDDRALRHGRVAAERGASLDRDYRRSGTGVNDKVRDVHPEVPWRVITDMRNRVTHGYFDIDLDVVWNTVTRDLPKLKESVARIRAELDSEAENAQEE